MKCPLFVQAIVAYQGNDQEAKLDCLKEECAWWDNTNGLCAILQLSKAVYHDGMYLPQIAKELTLRKYI
jgi:hypothetical protein